MQGIGEHDFVALAWQLPLRDHPKPVN